MTPPASPSSGGRRPTAAALSLLLALAVAACAHPSAGAASSSGAAAPASSAVTTAPAAPAPGTGYAQGDLVPAHDTFTVRSAALGESRPINVYLPPRYRANGASTPLPVLYMPDGGVDEDFAHVANTVDSLIALGAIRPTIIVGIPNTERRRDLTGPTRIAADSQIAKHVGGSAPFRRFLREELLPEVARRYRVTGERGLVGESLAGLFVVETLLREPTLFTHYVAFDPSLWWNGGALADSAATLLGAAGAAFGARTLYVANSGDERGTGMARLAAALRAAAPPELRWTHDPRPQLTHGTIFRALAPAALAGALR